MIKVYTDASLSDTFATVSCMVLSDSKFLGYNTWKFDNITKSYQAEVLGIQAGINYARTLRSSSKETITVFTDSKAALSTIFGTHTPHMTQAREAVIEIRTLCKKEPILLKHIKGHQESVNPNNIVDNMARHAMRSNRRIANES